MQSNKIFSEKLNDYGVYEYRGFKYTEEFRKSIKNAGLRIKIIIDNFLDFDINKIILESKTKTQTMKFIRGYDGNEIKISTVLKSSDETIGCIYG